MACKRTPTLTQRSNLLPTGSIRSNLPWGGATRNARSTSAGRIQVNGRAFSRQTKMAEQAERRVRHLVAGLGVTLSRCYTAITYSSLKFVFGIICLLVILGIWETPIVILGNRKSVIECECCSCLPMMSQNFYLSVLF